MKKIVVFLINFIFLSSSLTFAQKVQKDFFDGEVYMKIKNDIPFVFDTLHSNVDIPSKLSFLIPLLNKYGITKAEASFYFSKSDILKRTFRIHFRKSELVELLIKEMKKIKQIEYAEKVPIMRVSYTPNDPIFVYPNQYALFNIHAQKAWDFLRGDIYTPIAIVDNAIDINHVEFLNKNVTPVDISDDDHDPTPPTKDPDSPWGHGTHCAGIACADTDNGIGIASIGFNSSLYAIKATPNSGDPNYTYDGYEGIGWAMAAGVKIISCSWGGGEFSFTGFNTIAAAASLDVTIIVSAGNKNTTDLRYPASYGASFPQTVVVVAAVDINDKKADFSNYGSGITVTAPGVAILSTVPGNDYRWKDGTSMAAPLVAGLCALLRSTGLSSAGAINCLGATADNIDAQNPGYIGQLGAGRINAERAVKCAMPCYPSINLGSGIFSTLKTESSGTITSANTIPANAQVTFDAAVKINLQPGFLANSGSSFHAYIDGCGNKFALNDNTKKESKAIVNKTDKNLQLNSLNTNSLNVYPNPAVSIVNVVFNSTKKESNVLLQVYDINGIKAKEISLRNLMPGKQTIKLNLSGLSSGTYYLRLQLATEQLTAKVVLTK